MDYYVFAGFLGFSLAVIFPITTLAYYQPFHIVSLLCWFHHLVIGMLSVYLVVSGNYRRYNWKNLMGVILALAVLSVITNHFLGTNFLSLNNARGQFPITALQRLLGQYAVLIIIALLVMAAYSLHILLLYYDKKDQKGAK